MIREQPETMGRCYATTPMILPNNIGGSKYRYATEGSIARQREYSPALGINHTASELLYYVDKYLGPTSTTNKKYVTL